MVIEELIALLGFDIKGEEKLKRFQASMDQTRQRLAAFASVARVAAVAAGGLAGYMAGALARSSIETGAQFEKLATTLETIEGTSAKAKQSLDWVTEFAVKTPYELQEVANAFVKMRAYGLDPTNGSLMALGNAASAMGKDFNAAVEAMADASTGENERLKEFGITSEKAGDRITYNWMQNGKKMTKTVKKDGKEITKALTDIFEGRFAGAMDKQSRTWNGLMSNLSDAWQGFKRSIADSGWFLYSKGKLSALLGEIQRLRDNGTLDAWASRISRAFIRASQSAERFLWAGRKLVESGWWKPLSIGLGLLLMRLFPLTTLLLAAGLAFDDFLAFLRGDESVLGDFSVWLQQALGLSQGFVDKMIIIFGALTATALLAKMVGLGPALVAAITALAPAVAGAFTTLFALLSNPVGWAVILAGVGAAAAAYFWDDIKAAWNAINWSELGTSIAQGIVNGLKGTGSAITDAVRSVIPPELAGIGAAVQGAPGPGATVGGKVGSELGAALSSRPSAGFAGKLGNGPTTTNNNTDVAVGGITVNVQQSNASPGSIGGATRDALVNGLRNLSVNAPSPATP